MGESQNYGRAEERKSYCLTNVGERRIDPFVTAKTHQQHGTVL